MAAIYLVRHGQASFGKADYDQLSEKGAKQAVMLGQYWRSNAAPYKFYCGDLLRHGQTLQYFTEGFQGKETPIITHSGLNEFNHVDILTRNNAQWHNFAKMSEEINQSTEPNKSFQKEFSIALERWTSGDKDQEYLESWLQFKKRCISALKDIIKQQEMTNRKVSINKVPNDILVFTSAGTISVIIQTILQLSDRQTLKINQQLRNTGVTKLLFSEKNLSIDYFNNYSHLTLAGPDMDTFR
ncbi:MAG: broad specificity phosphatase PhoE [Colwellia sp.]|jgi:broad specificity phosphatase PhoE